MKSNYKRLGNYIGVVDKRNRNLEIENLIGLSIQKKFIPSISNIIGTDMSTYRILNQNQFSYCSVTSRNGEKITIALYQEEKTAMVSQAYDVFEITNAKELLPEYLMMWFRRPEFDRYARFMSHGSVREMFSWEDMCEVMLPIPKPDKQKEIVKEYNSIVNRIALNNQLIQKLEETAQAIYKQWFVDGVDEEKLPEGWRKGIVNDLCDYSNKRISVDDLDLNNYISTENMLQNKAGVVSANSLPSFGSVTSFETDNILISNIRPYFKKIWLTNFTGGCSNDVLCFIPKANIPSLYVFQILEKDNFFEYVMAGSKGTKMPRGDKKWIMNYPTVIPSKELLEKFNQVANTMQNNIYQRRKENLKLSELKDLLLSKLATIEN